MAVLKIPGNIYVFLNRCPTLNSSNRNTLKLKAAIRKTYGPPEVIKIETIDQPIPKDDEVLVRVYATTVNRTDCANLTAKPFIMRFVLGLLKPRKTILGTDFAGKIAALGKNVKSLQLNDRVFGFRDTGLESQAEYITLVPEGNLLTIPENINYKEAAASIEGAHYAYTFVHKVKIKPGQRVLINGATGAIGSALLQFVKQYGAQITATCSTKNIELVRSLGADKIYDYTKEDFTMDLEKYDYVFDAVGKSSFGKCKSLLTDSGAYISSELGPNAQNLFFAIFSLFGMKKKVYFPIPYSVDKTLPYIKNFLEKDKFKPVVDREYALDDISQAYAYVLTGEKIGNVVIAI